MLVAPTEDGFRGRHLGHLGHLGVGLHGAHSSASVASMDSSGCSTMKNRKEWSEGTEQALQSVQTTGRAGSPDSLPADAPLLSTYPHASVLRLRVVQIVCGISAMVMGTVGFIEERGRLNLGLGIPAGAASVLAAAVSIHLSRSFSGPGFGGGGGGRCSKCCDGRLWRLRRLGPLAACWAVACLLHSALILAAITAFVAQFRHSAADRNQDILVVSLVQLSLSLATLAAEAALVAVECRRWPLKSD